MMLATSKVADPLCETYGMQEKKTIANMYQHYVEGFIKTIILRKLLESPKVSEETMATEERKKYWKYIWKHYNHYYYHYVFGVNSFKI